MNDRARKELAGRYVLNTLRNLSHIVNSVDIDRLRGKLAGVPAVVVGAGPSLDQNIAALRALGSRALIIATDTAWRPLANAAIDPHIVVAVDPTEANGRHLTDVPSAHVPWLFAEGSIDPPALARLAGRLGVFRVGVHHPWPWLQRLGVERPFVRVWGSVLTAAYELALAFGCDPIIFVGADLAFTNYQPYCRGTTFESEWAVHLARGVSLPRIWKNTLTARKLVWEPGVDGDRALTSPNLIEFRNWLVARSGEAAERRTVNATGAGILVGAAIEQTSLSAVLEPYGERSAALRSEIDTLLQKSANDRDIDGVLHGLVAIERETQSATPGSAPSTSADWLSFGGPTLSAAQIADAVAAGRGRLLDCETGTLAAPVAGLEPRAAFLSARVAVIAPDVLTDRGLPRAWVCATADDDHTIVTPISGRASIRVAADGSLTAGNPWPCDISGEVAWGRAGGGLAWNRQTRTILFRRESGASPIEEAVPFEPARIALLPDGSAIWYAFDGGLWEWLPKSSGRFLTETPKSGGLFVDGTDLVLAPIVRDDKGQMVRQRLHHEWRFDIVSSVLRRVEIGNEGQCVAAAVRADWTARAFRFSDFIRLDHQDGRSLLLACPAPYGVAWAGQSLLTTSGAGDVILFCDLVSHLAGLA